MKQLIAIREDNSLYYSIWVNGKLKGNSFTKHEASLFYRGIMTGIEAAGGEVELDESIYKVFS